jgi:mono/diheme cytochrome c family protein
MRKKIFILLALVCFLFVAVGSGLAEQKTGNEKKGKYLYRKNCRACHIDGGSAMALSPNSKTQEQWERVFAKYERLKCADEWKKLTETDLNDILSYLYNHAFDSPTPATCG